MFGVFVSRREGKVTTFGVWVNAVVLSALFSLPVVSGYKVPGAYASTEVSPSLDPLAQSLPPIPSEPEDDIPIQVLPEEVLELMHGGPAVSRPAVNLESPEVVLAGFSPALSGVATPQAVSGSVERSCTDLMEAVMAADSAGDVVETILSALPVLAQYPDSHEAWRAQILLEDRLSEASPAQLASLASALMNSAAPTTPAEGLVTCRVVAAYARTGEALEAYDHVAATSTALLTAWPNASEAYDAVPVCLEALDVLGRALEAETLRDSLSGTLAAWRLTEFQSGEAPAWDTLVSSEACYGLLAAWHRQMQQAERTKAAVDPALVEQGCSLGDAALWSYPASAAQARMVPLYFDFVEHLAASERTERVLGLKERADAAPSSLGVDDAHILVQGVYVASP